jgi:PAS domain S-box-containing protein
MVPVDWGSGWSTRDRLYGYTKAEAVGQPITMLIPADRLPEETLILNKIKRGERVDHFETVRLHKDGSIFVCHSHEWPRPGPGLS